MAISSTDCRTRVQRGEPVWYLVPDGVVQYIGKYGFTDHRRRPGLRPCPAAGRPAPSAERSARAGGRERLGQ